MAAATTTDLKSNWLVTVRNDRTSWDKDSHVHLMRLTTRRDVDIVLTILQEKLKYNDVFIMKEGHDHVWEDPAHRDTGGKISWRISEEDLFPAFRLALIGAVMEEFCDGGDVIGVVALTKPAGKDPVNDLQVWFKTHANTAKPNIMSAYKDPRATPFSDSIGKLGKPKGK